MCWFCSGCEFVCNWQASLVTESLLCPPKCVQLTGFVGHRISLVPTEFHNNNNKCTKFEFIFFSPYIFNTFYNCYLNRKMESKIVIKPIKFTNVKNEGVHITNDAKIKNFHEISWKFWFLQVVDIIFCQKNKGYNFHNFRRYFLYFSDIFTIFPSKFPCTFLHNLVKIFIISIEISEISMKICEISMEIFIKFLKIFIIFL